LMMVVVLVLFAWTAPAMGQSLSSASQLWLNVSKPFNSFRNRISDAFSSLQSSVGVVSDTYGNSMSLGTGTHLGDNVVFTVRASNIPPEGMRYYWKARTYDIYNNWTWTTSITGQKAVAANNDAFQYPAWRDRERVAFIFTYNVTLGTTLYAPSTPLQFDRSGTATMLSLPDGSYDVEFIGANPPLTAGQSYTVSSWIGSPTLDDLTTSGTDYPQYIKDHYLKLPDKISPKFGELAKQLTAGLSNPYDQANAITQYLRRTIVYADSIPTPPTGQDPIEWFLFDYKKGFCNYYASAEVLLLRSLGIPARLAVGYAQGQSNTLQAVPLGAGRVADSYTVRNKDSHAWPEVYFNGLGWIEFEPTVSQPILSPPTASGATRDIPTGSLAERLAAAGDVKPQNPAFDAAINAAAIIEQSTHTTTFRVIGASVLLGVAGLAWVYRSKQAKIPALPVWLEENLNRRGVKVPRWLVRWSRWSLFSPLQRAYGVINQALTLLGHPARPSETPSERTASLGNFLPQVAGQAQIILSEYQQAEYGRYPGDTERARQASRKIRLESWKAFFRRLVHRP
jgi:transglutaminase-like putative cysteine protease